MKLAVFLFSMVALLSTSPKVEAFSDEEGLSYDSIVSKLSRPVERTEEPNPLDLVKFHPQVGVTDTFLTLEYPNGAKTYVEQKGFMAGLGIDLFSSDWIAEMGIISYGTQQYGPSSVSLQEFFLEVVYKSDFSRSLDFRLGAGLSARYLHIAYAGLNKGVPSDYSTPSSLLSVGLEAKISEKVALGADLVGHTSLIDDTPEHGSLSVGLRLNGNF
jgi:hypothetical protein